jgi:hypothetical protein
MTEEPHPANFRARAVIRVATANSDVWAGAGVIGWSDQSAAVYRDQHAGADQYQGSH